MAPGLLGGQGEMGQWVKGWFTTEAQATKSATQAAERRDRDTQQLMGDLKQQFDKSDTTNKDLTKAVSDFNQWMEKLQSSDSPLLGGAGGGGAGGAGGVSAGGQPVPAGSPASTGSGPVIPATKRTGVAMQAAMDQLRKEGVPEGNLKAAAAMLVGEAQMEFGLDPTKIHDQGTGYGIYGARLSRGDD